jgi:hypothetical protein
VILALARLRGVRRPLGRLLLQTLRRNPAAFQHTVSMAALYLHLGPFAKYLAARTREGIARETASPAKARPAAPPAVAAPPPLVAAAS